MKIGIYQTYWGCVGGGQRYVAVVAALLARSHDVEIVHHCENFIPASVEEAMQVDLSRVDFRYVPTIERPNWPTNNPFRRLQLERELGREISQPYDLYIDSSDIPPFFNHAKRGALLTHFPLVTFEEYHGRTSKEWRDRSLLKRWLSGAYQRLEWRLRFGSYDRCIVNSEFTKRWMKRLWGLDSQVVYPPLRDGLNPQTKHQAILSIGAIRGAQHKKQSMMIDSFKTLCENGLKEWRYVLMGASGPSEEDQSALRSLKESAFGYPVEIHHDVSGHELKNALETSAILWHSMGLGVDAEREPRQMEHFGMVITEAMAAGCVPIVFNGGGLPEILNNGENGFLWTNTHDLRQMTLRLTSDCNRLSKMSDAAVDRSSIFASPAFERRLLTTLSPLMDQT